MQSSMWQMISVQRHQVLVSGFHEKGIARGEVWSQGSLLSVRRLCPLHAWRTPKRCLSTLLPLPTRIRKDFGIRFRLQSPLGDYSGDYSGKTILIITHSYISGTPSVQLISKLDGDNTGIQKVDKIAAVRNQPPYVIMNGQGYVTCTRQIWVGRTQKKKRCVYHCKYL